MDPLRKHRQLGNPLDEILAFIRDTRFSQGLRCPRCGSEEVQGWGGFSGRKRYRCRGPCGRTFSDLTGTPAAYLKKLHLWADHGRCLAAGVTLESVSRRLGIHISTAFRWRHRALQGLREQDGEPLAGWIELRSEWFPDSRKGDRHLDRPPRPRGKPWYSPPLPYERRVLVACDRRGHVVTALLDHVTVRVGELAEVLGARLRGPVVFSPQQLPIGPCVSFAREVGGEVRLPWKARGSLVGNSAHTRTAWAYGRRLKGWMVRFRGVATRYLPNYLVWHRRVDAGARLGVEVGSLRWPQGP